MAARADNGAAALVLDDSSVRARRFSRPWRQVERLRVTAIVPATDSPPTLDRCLESLAAASPPPDEVIVASAPENSSPATARNAAARRARGELLVFVDSDVEVHPDTFRRIRAAFEREPGLTALFGSYNDAPTGRTAVSVFRNLLHHHVHQCSGGTATTFWAGLGAIRREAFLGTGGFDSERFRASSVEDIELGMRLAAGGADIRLDPALQGTHLKTWTLWDMLRTDFSRRGTPWLRILLESRTSSRALNLGWRHRLSAVASFAAVGALGGRRYSVAGGAVAVLLTLNRSFYALLIRRGGRRLAAIGVGLHVLHLLSAVASVPAAAALHLVRRKPPPSPPRTHRQRQFEFTGSPRESSD